VGSFHLATENTTFLLKQRILMRQGFKEKEMGRATIVELGDIVSELMPIWNEGVDVKDIDELWAVEDILKPE
jgi:hypothetical protein